MNQRDKIQNLLNKQKAIRKERQERLKVINEYCQKKTAEIQASSNEQLQTIQAEIDLLESNPKTGDRVTK